MYSGLFSALPPTTATYDFLFNWYLFFGVGAAVVVISLLAFFMIRYRAKGENQPPLHHKTEGWKIVLVTVMISLAILTAAEYQTFASFGNIEIPNDPNAVHIGVVAFQWGWNFTYPNGKYMLNNLTVPEGRTVILNITSRDVFHSFGIPFLAEKEDAIPGRVNQLWFEIPAGTQVPVDAIRCYELCGIGHAFMIANLTVVSQPAWDKWMGNG
ncbi:MAG TPA: cytochrome c oxidase subunit II [Nitrososphaerales archaeon]|nr:cytochrome c oxidase subunit II [Nitrososphaerales archaeon]